MTAFGHQSQKNHLTEITIYTFLRFLFQFNLNQELDSADERLKKLEAEHRRILSESADEKVRLETEVANAKSDLARAVISARRAERLALQASNERQAQVRSCRISWGGLRLRVTRA